MNTRLQVEHPVTELITNIDLVEHQIHIANGATLPFEQRDLTINGHAIEVRVYAEDPQENFMPSVGTLDTYQPPKGENIRVDDGYREGMEVPIQYDPMLSKLITWGKTRNEAIQLMIAAIKAYDVVGVKTTLPFGKFVCEHKAFQSGDFDTHFVKKYYSEKSSKQQIAKDAEIAAHVAMKLYLKDVNTVRLPNQK